MKTNEEGYVIPDGEGIIGVKPECMFSNYQLDIYEFALSKCKNKRRALDIGANVGVMSIRMADDFEMCESFEPLFHEYLSKNTKGKTSIHPYALGVKAETLTMRVGLYNSGKSDITSTKRKNQTYTDVEVKILDSFDFKNVDLIKIDVEGWEWQVMRGGKKTIEENLPTIMIEIHERYKYRNAIFEYFDKLGYDHKHMVKTQNINGVLKTVDDADYVFWRK